VLADFLRGLSFSSIGNHQRVFGYCFLPGEKNKIWRGFSRRQTSLSSHLNHFANSILEVSAFRATGQVLAAMRAETKLGSILRQPPLSVAILNEVL
jgi:hypothetical protein